MKEDGVCSACDYAYEKDNEIDWDERERQLQKVCDEHRSANGSWDVIVPSSGGKDSAALAIHMNNKHPEIDVEYFFTDTGYELSETYKFLDKLKTRLDKPIHYIQPVNSFDYYMKKYNNFLPSPMARWCTIEMKLKSMEKWLKPYLDAKDEIVSLIGIRFDERGRTGYKSNNPAIKARFPFIEDCIDREGV